MDQNALQPSWIEMCGFWVTHIKKFIKFRNNHTLPIAILDFRDNEFVFLIFLMNCWGYRFVCFFNGTKTYCQ